MKKLLLGLSAAVISTGVFAAEEASLSYTYIDVAHVTQELGPVDFTGFSLSGSRALNDNLFLVGSYRSTSKSSADLTTFDIGLGYHSALSSVVDFVGTAKLARNKVEGFGLSETNSGLDLSVGVRAMPVERLELEAAARYNASYDETQSGFLVAARFAIVPEFHVGVSYEGLSDIDQVSLQLRFSF